MTGLSEYTETSSADDSRLGVEVEDVSARQIFLNECDGLQNLLIADPVNNSSEVMKTRRLLTAQSATLFS